MELREFLTARLAEEARDAGLISSGGYQPQVWQIGAGTVGDGDADVEMQIGDDRYVAVRAVDRVIGGDLADDEDSGVVAFVRNGRNEHLHVVRYDPARVLRDVASSRKLLELADYLMGWSAEHVASVTGSEIKSMRFAGREIVRQLVKRWSGHPDYDPSWSPESVTGDS